jgi:hypothetical protein
MHGALDHGPSCHLAEHSCAALVEVPPLLRRARGKNDYDADKGPLSRENNRLRVLLDSDDPRLTIEVVT